ncbi:hypothetical protein M3569_21095, partial [Bacillus licheniformis]
YQVDMIIASVMMTCQIASLKPVTMLMPRKQRTIEIPLNALHISHPHRLAGRLNKYPNRKTNVVFTLQK